MKKILITGGEGFFSSRFVKRYKDEFNILALGRKELDITNEEMVIKSIEKFKPDYVIHAAAITVTDFCNKNPEMAYKINVQGAVNVAKACKKVNGKLIFISSEQVFNGNKERGPYDEEHTPVPNTVYGENKLEGEKLLKEIIKELWIVRFTWLFDLPQRGIKMAENIMWEVIKSLLEDKKIKASPNEFRGMTYSYEIIENFPKLFHLSYGIYHLGSENNLSRYDVVKYILEEMGLYNRLENLLIKDREKYKDNPRDIRLNTKKVQELGLKFSNTKDGLKKCIEDYNLNFIIKI